jgi:DMSO/TMAO reductase YedYZ heme-binding membrane subunit
MTATTVAPRALARGVLIAVVAVNVIVVELLFLTGGTGKNAILTAAKFAGLHAALVLMVQLLLIARIPWLDRRIGMDRLTAWHRWVGFALLWTVLLHAGLVVTGYATLGGAAWGSTLLALAGVPASLLGMCAAVLVVTTGALSVRAARRRLSYETWHALHLLVYLALLFALTHQLLEGTTIASSGWARAYWWTSWALVVGRWWPGGWCCRGGATPTTGSGWPRWCRSPTTWCRCMSPAGTWIGCRCGRGSSSSGGSPAIRAGDGRTRSRCRGRRTAGRCG